LERNFLQDKTRKNDNNNDNNYDNKFNKYDTTTTRCITILSDEDELCTNVHRAFMRNETLTAVVVEAVEYTVQSEPVFLRRLKGNDVTAEVIGTDSWQWVMSEEKIVLILE